MVSPPKDKANLRTGFTTGACSSAAARAATIACISGKAQRSVETTLPNGNPRSFAIDSCERDGDAWVASVIKDAGDDPDCTHGARLVARVSLSEEPGVQLLAREGIATVTKTGLGLEIGTLGITPIPRKNLTQQVEQALASAIEGAPGALVELSVPGGEKMAKETLNERLGLLGGISILGTTGIVRPYSTSAYRASVVNAIALASGMGRKAVALTTGGKTELYGMQQLPGWPEDTFVQAGDFIGTAVKSCARLGLRAVVVGMIGKLSKMADGKTMTHAAGSRVNLDLLADFAAEAGADATVQEAVRTSNTARGALEVCLATELAEFGFLVAKSAVRHLSDHVKHKTDIQALLIGFDGAVLGTWPRSLAASLPQPPTTGFAS